MKRAWSAETLRSVRYLLNASQTRPVADSPSSLLLTVAIALVNLFVCVMFENPIKGDLTGQTFSLFLFVQGWAIFFLVLVDLSSHGAEILRKTLVMPIPPDGRLLYAFVSSVRNPIVLALAATEAFFLLVLHHHSIAAIIVIPLLVGTMAANIAMLASLAAVISIRKERPPTVISSYSILVLLCLAALSLMFHLPSIIGIVPPMSLTAHGVVAISSGQPGWALLLAASSAALFFLLGYVGRRFA